MTQLDDESDMTHLNMGTLGKWYEMKFRDLDDNRTTETPGMYTTFIVNLQIQSLIILYYNSILDSSSSLVSIQPMDPGVFTLR